MPARLEFTAEGHTYTLEGLPVPSVTTVLEPLLDWTGIPLGVLAEARAFGTRVHAACHLFNAGTLDWTSIDTEINAYLDCWERFLKLTGAVVIASELRVYSDRHQYAGTMDVLLDWDGRIVEADIKSGLIPATVGPQTEAYRVAYLEMTGTKITRRYVVALDPRRDCGYQLERLNDPRDWTVFQSALNCWRFINANRNRSY